VNFLRRSIFLIVVASVVASVGASVGASATHARQHSGMNMSARDLQSSTNSSTPATILPGMGNLHHQINTKSPEAQKFFDQGLTLAYAFNFDEAARSFKHASLLDPSAAMPYWGLALTLAPSYQAGPASARTNQIACDNLDAAKKLAANTPAIELAYIAALSKLFSRDPHAVPANLLRDYSSAMRELTKNYSDDPDAAALYAESVFDIHDWKLWTNDGQPESGTLEVVAALKEVLRRWPNHVGANHFYIHALEASPYPEHALASAHLLETLLPGAGHLVHMPAHIYMRTGDYAAAVKSNQAAIAADRAYFNLQGTSNITYRLGYAEHNYLFLIAAAEMDGDYDAALSAAKQLESDAHDPHLDAGLAEKLMVNTILVPLRFAKWDDVLALPAPDKNFMGLAFFWHYARGCAFAAKEDVPKAKVEQAATHSLFNQLPQGPSGIMPFSWRTTHDITSSALAGRIAIAQNDFPMAIACWRAEEEVQDKMGFADPPAWYYPMRETLGAVLLQNGQLTEAEKVFRADLKRNPNNPRSLFGLWKTLEAEKKPDEAAAARKSFEAAWKGGANQLRIEDF
jgi:tetratricopeptide (TPR) repeat protein